MLISAKTQILNGITLAEFIGKCTYIGHNGVSGVEYVLASENFRMKNYMHSSNWNSLDT